MTPPVYVPLDEATIVELMDVLTRTDRMDLALRIGVSFNENNQEVHDEWTPFLAVAKDKYAREGELELDDNAIVSISESGGAYVQMWRWVSNEEAGVEQVWSFGEDIPTCPKCGARTNVTEAKADGVEQHTCLGFGCGYVFLVDTLEEV